MTAPARARFRAPWIALPLAAILTLGTAAPAMADDDAAPEVPAAEAPAPAPEPPAPAPPAPEPAPGPPEAPAEPEPSGDPAPEIEEAGADEVPESRGSARAAAEQPAVVAASVTPSISVSPSTGLADGATVTVDVTLPATITAELGASAGTDLTTGVYLMYCVQPAGVVGTSAGRATGAQCDAAKQQSLSSAATPYGTSVVGSVTDGVWTFSRTMTVEDAFGDHVCLNAAAAGAGGEQCGVFLRLYHVFSASNLEDPYAYDRFVPVTFAAPAAPGYGVTVTPTTGLADGSTGTVSATLPATITAELGASAGTALTTGVYLMYCVQPAEAVGTAAGRASGAMCDSGRQQSLSSAPTMYGTTVVGSVTDGVWSFDREFSVAEAFGDHSCVDAAAAAAGGEQCGVFVRLFHVFTAGNVTDPYVYDRFIPVTFAAPGGPGGSGGSGGNGGSGGSGGGSGNPGTARPAITVSPSIVDPSVATTITIRGTGYRGPAAAQGVYVSVGSASHWQPGRVPAEGGWITSAWVPAAGLSGGAFTTTLTIPAGAMRSGGSYGVATFAAHQFSLTDRSLDAWAPLTVGLSGSGGPAGAAGSRGGVPGEPPAEEGIELQTTTIGEGGEIAATAGGFEPGETGIHVVLYSDPVVLDNDATADADGVVRWSGRLPVGVVGSHTLTFQGSIDVGVPIEITPRIAAACTVDDAVLEWGFKETFRSYLGSSIAHGAWTTSGGAAYETPAFTWPAGRGDRDEEAGAVSLAFGGGVRFTAHGGALDTTISNPRIEIAGGGGLLLLDIEGTTQDGRDVVRVGVPFAELDPGAVEAVARDGVIELTGIPAVLTAEGSEVFGTYPAGEELDPVTLTLPEGDCARVGAGQGPLAASAAGEPQGIPAWVLWALAIVLPAALAVVAIVLVRRRRS